MGLHMCCLSWRVVSDFRCGKLLLQPLDWLLLEVSISCQDGVDGSFLTALTFLTTAELCEVQCRSHRFFLFSNLWLYLMFDFSYWPVFLCLVVCSFERVFLCDLPIEEDRSRRNQEKGRVSDLCILCCLLFVLSRDGCQVS